MEKWFQMSKGPRPDDGTHQRRVLRVSGLRYRREVHLTPGGLLRGSILPAPRRPGVRLHGARKGPGPFLVRPDAAL